MIAMWPSVVKEFRALFPLWVACIAAIALYPLTDSDLFQSLAILAYAMGALALGAHAIGHEYSHRTLGSLLALPVERRAVLLTKLAVLTPMLAALGAAGWYLILSRFGEPRPILGFAFLPLAGGLFVAPWLTMMSRNQLAGVMLTGTAAGWSLVATTMLVAWLSGQTMDQAEQSGREIWLATMYVFAATSAMLGWRTFMRLEAIEGGGAAIHLPRWFRTAEPARGRHPVWLLIGKELRLQQLTFAMAGVFVAGWAALSLLVTERVPHSGEEVTQALIPIYMVAVALVAGSLASAEERQYGVVESQQLLPMSARQQWTIKAGVAVTLAWLLGIGVTGLARYANGPEDWTGAFLHDVRIGALLTGVVAACSLYVSSLSSSGVRALAAAFPFVIGAFTLSRFSGNTMLPRISGSSLETVPLAIVVAAVGFSALLLWFAGANHRRADRSVGRVLLQMGSAAAFIVIGFPLIAAILVL